MAFAPCGAWSTLQACHQVWECIQCPTFEGEQGASPGEAEQGQTLWYSRWGPSGTSPCWLRLQRSRHKPPQCWHVVCVVQRWDRLKVARLRDMGVVLFLVGEIRQGFLEEKPFLLTPDDNCEPGERRYLVPRGTFWEASHCRAPS
jgi:hypothetical protein